jgi:hypothetical protein
MIRVAPALPLRCMRMCAVPAVEVKKAPARLLDSEQAQCAN